MRFFLLVLCLLALRPAWAEPLLHPDERWDTPARAGSRLTPRPPLVAETDTRPAFTRQIVRVQWRTLDPIDLYVIRPVGAQKPPAVLYLYSYPQDTHRFMDDAYCERLTRNGCAAVGFESALTGGRYHDRPMREWFVSELPEALSESAHDVSCILDYLAGRGDLDSTRFAMFGQGSGGTIALLAAAADTRLHAVDILNPWADWPRWLAQSPLVPENERPRYRTPAFLKTAAPLDPVRFLPRLKNRAVRLTWTADDDAVPAACRAALVQAAPPSTQIVRLTDPAAAFSALGGGRVFLWTAEQLHALPPPAFSLHPTVSAPSPQK